MTSTSPPDLAYDSQGSTDGAPDFSHSDALRTGRSAGSIRSAVVAAALYLVPAMLLYLPVWSASTRVIAGYGRDPQMFVWYMAWTPFALSHGQNPLLTSFVGYPHVANLMWN